MLEKWLTETYAYEPPERGEIREGILLEIDNYGAVVDLGFKHDGIVPRKDLDRLEEESVSDLEPGQEIKTKIIRPHDQEGDLVLSLFQVKAEKDWQKAEEMIDRDENGQTEVTGYNKGGLLVNFEHLQGFIPASHLSVERRELAQDRRQKTLESYIGEELPVKIIEVDQDNERLIFSERLARTEALLDEIEVGQVRQGTVRQIRDFGAFVDLGGMKGLVHISEMSWRRIGHPGEVVEVGDEVEVKVLSIDPERKRVSLSMKELEPNPWDEIETTYAPDQLTSGTVTNVVDFGAFVLLDSGIEGLVHISEMADPEPDDPREFVERDDKVTVRILSIDPFRQRMALSLKRVSDEDRKAMLNQPELTVSD